MISLIRKFVSEIESRKRQSYINKLQQKGLCLGNNVQFAGEIFLDPSHCMLIEIGSDCTFAPRVKLIAHDASTKLFLGYTRLAPIKIGNKCFLGESVIVLPGVSIGEHSIIGAGAVVTKDIKAGSVAAGNPAKVICSTDEYLQKIRERAKKTTIYDSTFHIEQLDNNKRQILLNAAEKGEAFIE